jgi:hypothetical protein
MTSTAELTRHPKLTFIAIDDLTTEARFSMDGWGSDIVCKYWKVENHGRSDPWRYELERIEGKGGVFSHPSEDGCRLAIVRHLIDFGLIDIPEDNHHLDARNTAIAVTTQAARENMTGPRIGDFIEMTDGSLQRFCNKTKHGMQTTEGGSFHVTSTGTASYSGGLNPPQMMERIEDTGATKRGRFWFFSHAIAGAGRGVDVFLPCRVYRLTELSMTEEEARNHPAARGMAEFWGENHPDHLRQIAKLMEGRL